MDKTPPKMQTEVPKRKRVLIVKVLDRYPDIRVDHIQKEIAIISAINFLWS